jgi:DNA repair exonuclease SbcCD ATPase subunit
VIPRKVTLENFLSYGPEQTIHFEDNEPLWVVSGPNGVGKSAIFDAITYCLYAQHRGGGQGHEQLIRKGQNSFRVAFEFEFANKTYRVSRTYGKKPTQQVEELIESQWKRVPNVDGTKAVTEWVVKTIGLTFDAFTASVLLRQGKSDDILDATPTARAETLKKIIGVERFEQLSEAVSQARKGRASSSIFRGSVRICPVSARRNCTSRLCGSSRPEPAARPPTPPGKPPPRRCRRPGNG